VIRSVTLRGADWAFDRDELARTFSGRQGHRDQHAVQPVRKVFTHDELAFIAELCVRHDCLAITDEI